MTDDIIRALARHVTMAIIHVDEQSLAIAAYQPMVVSLTNSLIREELHRIAGIIVEEGEKDGEI
jgi:hypothetical protein